MRALTRTAYRIGGRLPSAVKRAMTRSREATFLVAVLGVVLDEDGRVLLFKHTYRPFAPWGLPSGWLKPGESPGESIVREIAEESGLAAGFVDVLEVRTAERPRRLDLWLRCRALGGAARPSAEVEDARFFELGALPPLIGEQERFLREFRPRLGS